MSTIAAISTPFGVGGIAVVRLSGPDAHRILSRHVTLPKENRQVFFALFRIADKGNNCATVLDEVVVTRYHAPNSYTGEEMAEISCHGSLYIQQTLLQALIGSGARLAEPGEFTRRAFLNGKLDLSQAEAVADLIDSTNAGAAQLAISQLRGGYAQRLTELRDKFIELTALLELELDFSDEEVEFADRSQLLSLSDSLAEECRRLCDSFQLGNAIKNGIPIAIVGQPNVGKSTLLNALVGEERAIVSNIAGTTRDTIEDTVTLDGIGFRFIDTAGIRHSDDDIESQGIERSYQAATKAQVVLYMIDAAQAYTAKAQLEEFSQHVNLKDKRLILLLNKCDCIAPNKQPNTSNNNPLSNPSNGCQLSLSTLTISAKHGQGLEELRQLITFPYRTDQNSNRSNQLPLVTNIRHYEALKNTLAALALVRQGLQQQIPADLVVIDLRDALHHLGTITGQVTSDQVLGAIFSRFCIGK